jgi:polyferredoxin
MRRIVQSAAFLLFLIYIVVAPAMAAARQVRGDWLMRLSPFSGIAASASAWELIGPFWPAAVLLVLALLLGRYFCGWLCPLGATIDLWDRLTSRARPRPKREAGAEGEEEHDFEHVRARRLKYYILAACLVGAFLGVSFFGLFDPLSIAVRSYVLAIHSYVARGLISALNALGWSNSAGAVRRTLLARPDPVFELHLATFAVLLVILATGFVRRRFWCRYLCPLGAVYALAAKPAVTKRNATDACIRCGRCAEACPMGCISPDGRRTLNDECVLCMQCQPVCPVDAVRFLGRTPVEQKREIDLSRRGVVAAVASGAVAVPVLGTRRSWLHAKDDPLIRPPLAGRDTEEFLRKCLRCGQCMRVCTNQVIQPAGLEAGLESVWTPKLSPRPGYCEYNCNRCGQACPSGAIPRFNINEKHHTAIGLAYFDTTRCIPWRGLSRRGEEGWRADDHNCGVCEEVCPVPGKAIHFRREEIGGRELRLPYVRKEACVGCGYCEAVCPVVGAAAVRVTGGFREVVVQRVTRAATVAATEAALPATCGELRLADEKRTHTGPDELWDYINGGGEPYLAYGFVLVTETRYAGPAGQVKVDLWQFEDADGAFGGFSKDRGGESVAVGDEGAMRSGSLWARRGRYYLAIVNPEGVPDEQVLLLGRTILSNLNAPPAPRPEICRMLPPDGLDEMTVRYIRDTLPFYDIALHDRFLPDAVWGLTGSEPAAYGAYPGTRSDGRPVGVVLIRFGDEADAAAAAARLAATRTEWGEVQVADAPVAVFMAAEDHFGGVSAAGGLFAASFLAPSAEAASELVETALAR